MKIPLKSHTPLIASLCNLALSYVIYMLCRIVYVWENWSLFATGWESLSYADLFYGSLRFDSSAIFYTNTIHLALMLLPCLPKERDWWQTMCKWVYMVINSLAVVANLGDAVYSQYTGRRTTSTVFNEFGNEGNIGTILFTEILNHWYLVLIGAGLIALMWVLYTKPVVANDKCRNIIRWRYYVLQSVAFLSLFPIAVISIRGGATRAVRPITISNANQYVNQPHEAAIVLNTPFSLIRTIGKATFVDPGYFDSKILEQIYTPEHKPLPPDDADTLAGRFKGKNVVVLIVESFAREYIGYYHNGTFAGTCPGISDYQGYTPFFDSLMAHSLTWEHTYANGRKSIDGMPSILSSIPMFIEPFFTTCYSTNRIGGIAAELDKDGYTSAFFHGADNGSMGFQAFARTTGFKNYYGRTEYDADPQFGGENDFDGVWAIWDEPFLQFYVARMNEMQEPFVTTVFTASSHHPYNIPEQYKGIYREEGNPIHKCIRYTDNALRQFFKTAIRQPWFGNTLFIIVNDHTNLTSFDYYRTSQGTMCATIVFYDPSGILPTGVMHGIAQQIDIMPTLMSLLGIKSHYVAFGHNLLAGTDEPGWTVNYGNGIYQYLENDTLIQFDGQQVVNAFDMRADPMMRHPIGHHPPKHETRLKAIIQQYMSRMINDKLTVQ